MTTSPYFNHFTQANEQNLVEDLIIESIRVYGHDMKYVIREDVNEDTTLNEYEYATYNTAVDLEFYIKSTMSFEGQGLFMEKFGLQVKDQIVLTVAKRSFANTVTAANSSITRPREGDVIYVPMLDALYEVNFVDNSMAFYQLGEMQTYDITCEVYETGYDQFNTGNTSIDAYNSYSNNANHPYDQGTDFETEANSILDFSESNPFTDGF